jgi:hypothetical protein
MYVKLSTLCPTVVREAAAGRRGCQDAAAITRGDAWRRPIIGILPRGRDVRTPRPCMGAWAIACCHANMPCMSTTTYSCRAEIDRSVWHRGIRCSQIPIEPVRSRCCVRCGRLAGLARARVHGKKDLRLRSDRSSVKDGCNAKEARSSRPAGVTKSTRALVSRTSSSDSLASSLRRLGRLPRSAQQGSARSCAWLGASSRAAAAPQE